MNNKPKSKNPKLEKFLKEINDLGTKYQYQIVPVLTYTPQGIVPNIRIIDVVPKDDNVKPKNGDSTIPDIKPEKTDKVIQ